MTDERERVEDWSPYTCRIDAESNDWPYMLYVQYSHLYCSFIFYTSQDQTKTHNSHKSGEDEEREEEETEEEEAEKLQKAREWDEYKDGESNTYDFMVSRQCSTIAKCCKVHKRFNLRTLSNT